MSIFLIIISAFQRKIIVLKLFSFIEPVSTLREQDEKSATWFDDYYTIHFIDSETIAIGEPRYQQQNYSYLILGDKRAILFDSGSGRRNIKPVVDSLTSLPVTVISSHLHFDHIGSHNQFDKIAVVDLPNLRRRTEKGFLQLSEEETLGFIENKKSPKLKISEWWKPDSQIEIGGRTLTVIHTPGHTNDSIALFDEDHKQLFIGDFIFPGVLIGLLPGSSFKSYLKTSRKLVKQISSDVKVFSAHRKEDRGIPLLGFTDLFDLKVALELISQSDLEGDGFYVKLFKINSKIQIAIECPLYAFCL
ncbi:MAG: MBL fold metallo-hydrolase [Halobacteriovoraceae bacterium]|jgi:hydroxyacylglutathione hydrolase|nr:MBL fold metallo-hydrolase [Halobacteriovoraceae bacterium]